MTGGPPASPAALAAAARVLAFGRAGLPRCPELANLANSAGVAQYVRIAGELAARVGTGPVLDWGAGWGQTSLLLATFGVDVTAYDVEDKGAASGLLAGTAVRYLVSDAPTLPFDDGVFAGVLNCGVLEHVEDEARALAELRRVLRQGGWLLTYHLPNRHALTEWLGRRLGRFHHERTYTREEAIRTFQGAGFRVEACQPFHLLPRNIWSRLPGRLASRAGLARLIDGTDRVLMAGPGLARLATAWSLVARRP